jgi:hypothetical protein
MLGAGFAFAAFGIWLVAALRRSRTGAASPAQVPTD